MRTATVEMEWAEVRRNGRKIEDWTYVVTFKNDDQVVEERCIKTAHDAGMMVTMYELGYMSLDEYGGVAPTNVFG